MIKMDKASHDNELMDKVIVFLIVLVGAILIFSQYQFYKILQNNILVYVSGILILALIVFIAWLFIEKSPREEHHSAHAHQTHAHHDDITLKEQKVPLTLIEKVSYGMISLVAVLIVFNQIQISQASALAGFQGNGLTFKSSSTKQTVLTGDPAQDAMAIVIPRGMPFYGEALGVSFDDPIKSLEIIAQLDPSYGRNKVQLTQEERERYIRIGTTPSMGCQYCCGADTAVTKDGRPTCGCKHSWAIRGLAAYLVKNYPQLSDQEIMKELSKWKGLFFPKQMIQKYIQESQSGQYTPDIASLLLDVDEKKLKSMKAAVASSGNAQSSSDTSSNINNLPSMVGGC